MADDTTKVGQADRIRINVNQPHERRYWTKRFYLKSQKELRRIVKEIGPMVSDMKKFLIERIENG